MMLRRHSWPARRRSLVRRPARPASSRRPRPRSSRPSRSWATSCARSAAIASSSRPGRRRHRRPHLSAQADRRAHAGHGAGAGQQRAGLRGLDRPPGQGRAVQGPRHRRHRPACRRCRARRRPATAMRTAPIRIAGRMSTARGATSRTSPRASPRPMPRTPQSIATRGAAYDKRLAALDPWIKARDRQGAGGAAPRRSPATTRSAISQRLRRAVRGAARLQHRERAVGARRGGADPPGARAEDQGAVRREHEQPRPGRPDRPRIRAPWSARGSTATRCPSPAARRRPTRR